MNQTDFRVLVSAIIKDVDDSVILDWQKKKGKINLTVGLDASSLSKSQSDIKTYIDKIKATTDGMTNASFTKIVSGNQEAITKALVTYNNGLGQTVKQTWALNEAKKMSAEIGYKEGLY